MEVQRTHASHGRLKKWRAKIGQILQNKGNAEMADRPCFTSPHLCMGKVEAQPTRKVSSTPLRASLSNLRRSEGELVPEETACQFGKSWNPARLLERGHFRASGPRNRKNKKKR